MSNSVLIADAVVTVIGRCLTCRPLCRRLPHAQSCWMLVSSTRWSHGSPSSNNDSHRLPRRRKCSSSRANSTRYTHCIGQVYCDVVRYVLNEVARCSGYSVGLAINRSRVQVLLEAMLCNYLGQVVHTYVPLLPSSITWYWPKGSDALQQGR